MSGSIRDSGKEHATGTQHDHNTRNSKLTKFGNEYSWVTLYFDKRCMSVAILGTINMLAWCPPLEK